MEFLPKILMGSTDFKPEDLIDMQHYDVSDTPKDALTLELESFVNCINEDKKPIVDGFAGMRALKIALQIIACIQTQNNKQLREY